MEFKFNEEEFFRLFKEKGIFERSGQLFCISGDKVKYNQLVKYLILLEDNGKIESFIIRY
jgi:hypothetical protein